MRFLPFLLILVLAGTALASVSCTTSGQSNANYARPYYATPRVDPYATPGLWDVRQGGGSTSIGYRN